MSARAHFAFEHERFYVYSERASARAVSLAAVWVEAVSRAAVWAAAVSPGAEVSEGEVVPAAVAAAAAGSIAAAAPRSRGLFPRAPPEAFSPPTRG